ncbi:unnamed protein product [Rhizoctonia solani]|uniref:Protein kinase domain-containing protein n=1 Tax=Rhizoctonia solani TaxID=456999 RepID=A0A8H3AES0_9AGAM|nr:unnamed protein product [Rhizoctonia solani]
MLVRSAQLYEHDWAICQCDRCRDYKLGVCNMQRRFGRVLVALPPRYRQDPDPVIVDSAPIASPSSIGYFINCVSSRLSMLASNARYVVNYAFSNPAASTTTVSKRPTVPTSHMTQRDVFNCLAGERGFMELSSKLPAWADIPPIPCDGGGFGVIYRSTKKDGTVISIKCLRPGHHTNSESESKKAKEAGRELYNWFKAKHRNVLELYGIALYNGQIAMISPWMDNGNLRNYVNSRPEVNRWAMCCQVAEGLAHIHGIGMVHGDIKGENILVSNDGVVKIGDFGNSILEECSLRYSTTSNTGGGTVRWMAWELVHPMGPPVRKSVMTDIYSLAMTILEVMTGEKPYAEYKHDAAVLGALFRREVPNRPSQFGSNQHLGDERWALLLRCWHIDSSRRPASPMVFEVMKELQ